jgi:transcriptional regulator with XRE-family HTH domain
LGDVLRALRDAKGLSQEAVAHAADYDRSYVGQLERGERWPTVESVWAVLHVLGVSWREFGEALDAQPAFLQTPARKQTGTPD